MAKGLSIVRKSRLWITPSSSDKCIREVYDSKVDLSNERKFVNDNRKTLSSRGFVDEKTSVTDVGCGFSSSVLECQRQVIDAGGIDIFAAEIELARERAKLYRGNPEKFLTLDGQNAVEALDRKFDVVFSHQVVEHVDKYRGYIDGSLEYLKPDGAFVVQAPNYLWRWRGPHHCIWWLPCMPRILARFIVKIRHLSLEYFDTKLRLVNKYMILSHLQKRGYNIEPYNSFKLQTMQIASAVKRSIAHMVEITRTQGVLRLFMKWYPFTSSISHIAYGQA